MAAKVKEIKDSKQIEEVSKKKDSIKSKNEGNTGLGFSSFEK